MGKLCSLCRSYSTKCNAHFKDPWYRISLYSKLLLVGQPAIGSAENHHLCLQGCSDLFRNLTWFYSGTLIRSIRDWWQMCHFSQVATRFSNFRPLASIWNFRAAVRSSQSPWVTKRFRNWFWARFYMLLYASFQPKAIYLSPAVSTNTLQTVNVPFHGGVEMRRSWIMQIPISDILQVFGAILAHTIVELELWETRFAQTGDKPNILQTRSQYIKWLQTTTGSLNDPRQLNPIRKGHEDLAHPVHVGTILRKKRSNKKWSSRDAHQIWNKIQGNKSKQSEKLKWST